MPKHQIEGPSRVIFGRQHNRRSARFWIVVRGIGIGLVLKKQLNYSDQFRDRVPLDLLLHHGGYQPFK